MTTWKDCRIQKYRFIDVDIGELLLYRKISTYIFYQRKVKYGRQASEKRSITLPSIIVSLETGYARLKTIHNLLNVQEGDRLAQQIPRNFMGIY